MTVHFKVHLQCMMTGKHTNDVSDTSQYLELQFRQEVEEIMEQGYPAGIYNCIRGRGLCA